jgi:hypothetical protein
MKTRGETAKMAAPKEQATNVVNLSGKKTLVGRGSGESFTWMKPPKRKAVIGKLSGERTEILD